MSFKGVTTALGDFARSFEGAVKSGALDDLLTGLTPILDTLAVKLKAAALALPEALALVDFSPFVDAIRNIVGRVSKLFDGIDVGTPEGLAELIQFVVNSTAGLENVIAGIVSGFAAFAGPIVAAAQAFADLDSDTQSAIGGLLGFVKVIDVLLPSIGTLGGALFAIGGGLKLVGGIGALAGTFGTVSGSAGALTAALGAGGLAGALGSVAALGVTAFAGFKAGSFIADNDVGGIKTATSAVIEWGDKLGDFTGLQGNANAALERGEEITRRYRERMAEAAGEVSDFGKDIEAAARSQEVLTGHIAGAGSELGTLTKKVKEAAVEQDGYGKSIALIGAPLTSLERTQKEVAETVGRLKKDFPDVVDTIRNYGEQAKTSSKSMGDLAGASEEARLKILEITSKEHIALIEARVEIDTAKVNAARDITVAAFQSIDSAIQSTGDTVTSLFELLGSDEFNANTGAISQNKLREAIDAEVKARQEQLAVQVELTKATLEETRARTQRLATGLAEIQITADGLEPELQAFMYRILDRIQIQATSEGAEFLLGLPT